MKIFLTPHQNKVYEDYNVITPQQLGNPFNLTSAGVDDGELDALFVDEFISLTAFGNMEKAVQDFVKKVKIGGKVFFTAPDFIRVSRAFNSFTLNLEQVNQLVGGRAVVDYKLASNLIRKAGVKILREDFRDYHFYIMGERIQ